MAATALLAGGSSAFAQDEMTLQVFGDVNLGDTSAAGVHPSFALGDLDLFFQSSLGDDFELVAENLVEFSDEGAQFDTERLYIQYNLRPWLRLRAGRFHIPVGYYETAFHHAFLFQLTTERPIAWRFEDDGGALPAHVVGMEATGSRPLSDGTTLGYSAFVGNGRGRNADDVSDLHDFNGHKIVGGRLTVQLADLELGVSGSWDRIPGGLTDDTGMVLVPEDLSELILAAHAAYLHYPLEVIAEAIYLAHRGRQSGTNYPLTAGYLQAGYEIDRVTPYARIDLVSRDPDDPFFNASGTTGDATELRAGLRLRLHEKVVVKAEGAREFEDKINSVALQSAFSF